MMDYASPVEIPYAVVQFAEEKNEYLSNPNISIHFATKWKNYDVYYIKNSRLNNTVCGEPIYILHNEQTTRRATPNEITPIYATYKTNRKN